MSSPLEPPALDWEALGPLEREREYSPSSRLDGPIDPFIAAYINRSADQYERCGRNGTTVHEVRYGPKAGHTIDLVVPASNQAVPVLVFIHGGYWQELSKRESFFGAEDCLEQGHAFAAIDYTLAPHATLDEIVAECHAAVMRLAHTAPTFGIDPSRIVVAGSSAGAHLAAMVAVDAQCQPLLAGCCLLSGVFELEPLIGTTINDAVGLDTDAARRNSPALFDLTDFPPAVVAYGSNETDQFKRQSNRFAALVAKTGTEVSVLEVAGRNHFDVVFDLCDVSTELGRRTATLALI